MLSETPCSQWTMSSNRYWQTWWGCSSRACCQWCSYPVMLRIESVSFNKNSGISNFWPITGNQGNWLKIYPHLTPLAFEVDKPGKNNYSVVNFKQIILRKPIMRWAWDNIHNWCLVIAMIQPRPVNRVGDGVRDSITDGTKTVTSALKFQKSVIYKCSLLSQ